MKTQLPFLLIFVFSFSVNTCKQEETFSKTTSPENLEWWKEAKFGMFIHWGVYADPAGTWDTVVYPGYAEHLLRQAQIPLERYKKEVAQNFNPVNFDAEEWVKICKNAGMKYMVITSKHHDGFAMFDTKVPGWEDYDIVDGTKWGKDPMKALKAACTKHGIKFGFYYSHSQDWSHPYGQRNTWDYNHPVKRNTWFNDPKWSEHRENSMIYVKEKSIPQMKEIIKNYQPDIIWFDTRNWLPDEYNQVILTEARNIAPNTIFNSRSALGFADYQSTQDKPVEFPPIEGLWEAIPTTNESYGYHASDNAYKPSSHFIRLLSKASARGGNLLMNVGPMGSGQINPVDVKILYEIGDWLAINGEAIYGSERTILPVNAWGESTIKGSTLYLHVHEWPEDGNLIIGGLKSNIQEARLLGETQLLKHKRLNERDHIIQVPISAPDTIVSIIAVKFKSPLETDNIRLLATEKGINVLHVFDGIIHGPGLKYGGGNSKSNCLVNWKDKESYISWKIRANEPGSYAVKFIYDADKTAADNQYLIEFGTDSILKSVIPGNGFKPVDLGEITLDEGDTELVIRPARLESDELMTPRSIVLTFLR